MVKRVLMFGWEFPPRSVGGLGAVCYGLTKELSKEIDITFVVPGTMMETPPEFLNIISTGSSSPPSSTLIKIKTIRSPLTPYMTSSTYGEALERQPNSSLYGQNLFEEIQRYTEEAKKIAGRENFDIIHAHDWMTFKAGIEAKHVSGKPLIIHVHSTEFDRTGGNGINEHVYSTEKEGMEEADLIVAVSRFTRDKIVEHYGIAPDKIRVLYNAIERTDRRSNGCNDKKPFTGKEENNKMVLFLGRVTLQKGPDHFLHAAKRVLGHDPNVTFVIAGTGDMENATIEKAAELGIADRVLFTGFVDDVHEAYSLADLFVMPSVSEPFGLTCLEALSHGVPVLISNQSGVSEVLSHCLKADFWDVDDIASKVISVLRHGELRESLGSNGFAEIKKFSWGKQARRCINLYDELLLTTRNG